MTPSAAHPIAPYLLLAELGAALFGGTAASAAERITLEVIGAVRMADPETVRQAEAATRGAEVRPARAATAARSIDGMAARHN
ncbi:hypothetical protein [Methylobacterium sp. PvR107]|uniref:hypothetical protein n=1 Tax=Methylobacterium sp. PvR107 TaxID=2806597 RepID=UPI001AE4833A|nr:hypothetical protein [Methylobacterium sp. PvR107]MBP1181535.1 hypothetical protein [Methylobacterium sp. PvR107]